MRGAQFDLKRARHTRRHLPRRVFNSNARGVGLHNSEATRISAEVVEHDLERHNFALGDRAEVDLAGRALERNGVVPALAVFPCRLRCRAFH